MCTRKCAYCKEQIPILHDDIKDIICHKSKFYHKECFVKLVEEKLQGRSKKKEEWADALSNVDKLEKDTKVHLEEVIYRDKMLKWIIGHYDIISPPKRFSIAITELGKGIYKNKPCRTVSVMDLYNTWINEQDNLDKINERNQQNSKGPIKGEDRVMYDFRIVLDRVLIYKEQPVSENFNEAQSNIEHETKLKAIKQLEEQRIGIYAIEIPEIKAIYIGESLDVDRRWEKHIVDLKQGAHHNKRLQELYNHQFSMDFKILTSVPYVKGHDVRYKIFNLFFEGQLIQDFFSSQEWWVCNRELSYRKLSTTPELKEIQSWFTQSNISDYKDILKLPPEPDLFWEYFKERFYHNESDYKIEKDPLWDELFLYKKA